VENWETALSAAGPGGKLLFLAVSLLVSLLLAEGVVRGFAAWGGERGRRLAQFDPLALRFAPHGQFGYRQKPNSVYPFGNGTVAHSNSMAYRGPEVDRAKPPGTYRIVLLGGSTTRGFGVDDPFTIDTYMREMLARRYPDRRIEVINLALGGYDSYQIFERMLADGISLGPDLVILNAGINDVRNALFAGLEIPGPDRRTLIWEAHLKRERRAQAYGGHSLWTRLKHISFFARFPGFLFKLVTENQRMEQLRTAQPHSDAIEYFAANLERTAELAFQIAAPVIFSTPPSALRYFDPRSMSYRGYWLVDAATTEGYRERLAHRLEQLTQELAAEGSPVAYLSHDLPLDLFLENDDCHLNHEGNRALARRFVEAARPFIEARPTQPEPGQAPAA